MPSFTQTLVDRLARARRVAVLSGAGVSAESGVPTFRDEGGLWQKFEPQELAHVQAFLENTHPVQQWYAHRRALAREVEPNAAHRALADLERHVEDFTLATQNVDDLHRRAGSVRVIELHGNITRSYCIDCDRPAAEGDLAPRAEGAAATCPDCDGYLRPDVVWYGERLPAGAMDRAQAAARRADVFLSVGTSAVVYPAAGLLHVARAHGAYVAELNVEPSAAAGHVDEVVLGPAGEVLPQLVRAVRSSS